MSRSIIIVGASSGLGYAIAQKYISRGWQVGVASRRTELLQRLVDQAPERVFAQRIDVTEESASHHLLALIERVGGMDIYLHSAAVGFQNRDLTPDIEISTLRTDGEGFVRMITTAFNYFKGHGQGGTLAAITSVAATRGIANAPAYSAVKGMQGQYLDALSQLSLNQHLGIKISDIRPGFVATPFIGECPYPMVMSVEYASKRIVKAIDQQRRRVTIDWRYSLLTALWRIIPRFVWERIRV